MNTKTLSGNTPTSAINVSSVNSDLIPDTNNTRNLGSAALKWNNAYISTINTPTLSTPVITNASALSVTNASNPTMFFNNNAAGDISINFQTNSTVTNRLVASPGVSTNYIGIETTSGTAGYLYVDNILLFHNASITIGSPVTSSSLFTLNGGVTSSGLFTLNGGIKLLTTGGTPTTLNYYEELSHSTTWTGPWAAGSNPTVPIRLVKIGSVVTAQIGAIQVVGNSSSAAVANVTAIPARFRPITNNYNPLVSVLKGSTSTNQVGGVTVNTLGIITIGEDATFANFTATTNNVGPNAMSLTWNVI